MEIYPHKSFVIIKWQYKWSIPYSAWILEKVAAAATITATHEAIIQFMFLSLIDSPSTVWRA